MGEEIPIVETAQEAGLIIRSFTKQEELIPSGFKFMWGPGLFEKASFQDIVYTRLTETETGGSFARVGGVESWDEILKQVPKRYLKDPARFFRDLQAVLREQRTNDPALALVAGAMISDVKHGIREWVQLLSELYPMLVKLEEGPTSGRCSRPGTRIPAREDVTSYSDSTAALIVSSRDGSRPKSGNSRRSSPAGEATTSAGKPRGPNSLTPPSGG